MTAFFLFAAACFFYTALYVIHCVKTRQKTAAAGAALLTLAALGFAVFLVR